MTRGFGLIGWQAQGAGLDRHVGLRFWNNGVTIPRYRGTSVHLSPRSALLSVPRSEVDTRSPELRKVLRQQHEAVAEPTATGPPGDRALEWLRAIGESLQAPEKSKEKADVLQAIYDRITVAGPEIVGTRLTQATCAHGLALALPTKVALARPTGFEPADDISIRMPIEGAGDWLTSIESA